LSQAVRERAQAIRCAQKNIHRELSSVKKKKATSFSSGEGMWGGSSAQAHTELEYLDLEKRENGDAAPHEKPR
jgi:hypothetical protein